MKLIFKPHPATRKGSHEIIDLYSENGDLPWCSVHVDLLYSKDDNSLQQRIFRHGETLVFELVESAGDNNDGW